MTDTNWLPGLVVLGVAVAAGVALALKSRAGARLPQAETNQLAELKLQKDVAYTLLREHATAREAWEEGPWLRERDRLERVAAAVLRRIDAVGPIAAAPAEPARAGFAAKHPQLVGALYGAGGVGFVVALAFGLDQYSAPAPVEPMGGSDIAALQARVDAAPDDLVAKNKLGHALLNAGKVMEAYKLTEEVVKVDPENTEARTHQAIVLMNMGDLNMAAKLLDRVLTKAPADPETLGWRGAVHLQLGEREEAAKAWEAAIAADPKLEPMLRPLISDARGGATSAPTPEPAADARDVTGEIAGDSSLLRPGDTLFLVARPEGVERGPPTWVKKLTIRELPVAFRIGPADSMIGGEPPASVVLTARVDRDGNPTTRGPGDLEGKSAVVAPGATGVAIALVAIE